MSDIVIVLRHNTRKRLSTPNLECSIIITCSLCLQRMSIDIHDLIHHVILIFLLLPGDLYDQKYVEITFKKKILSFLHIWLYIHSRTGMVMSRELNIISVRIKKSYLVLLMLPCLSAYSRFYFT